MLFLYKPSVCVYSCWAPTLVVRAPFTLAPSNDDQNEVALLKVSGLSHWAGFCKKRQKNWRDELRPQETETPHNENLSKGIYGLAEKKRLSADADRTVFQKKVRFHKIRRWRESCEGNSANMIVLIGSSGERRWKKTSARRWQIENKVSFT